MKQLMWNYEATCLKEDGSREVMRKSVMNWLKDLGVEWLHSFQVDDVQHMSNDGALDIGALALTLKMYKANGWQMSVQVAETADLNFARANGGVVLCSEGSAEHINEKTSTSIQMACAEKTGTHAVGKARTRNAVAQQVKTVDLQSPKWTVLLEQLQRKNGGHMITTANRFLFNIATLDSNFPLILWYYGMSAGPVAPWL